MATLNRLKSIESHVNKEVISSGILHGKKEGKMHGNVTSVANTSGNRRSDGRGGLFFLSKRASTSIVLDFGQLLKSE